MKLSSIVLSSILTLCTTINGKPLIDNPEAKNEMIKNSIPLNPIFNPCAFGLNLRVGQIVQCALKNGKYYQKYIESKCTNDFVCFIPDEENSNAEYIIVIDNKNYSSVDTSTIDVCNPINKSYDFVECVKEAKNRFSNLEYELVHRPISRPVETIDVPPPLPTSIPPTLTFPFFVESTNTFTRSYETITFEKVPFEGIKPTDPIIRPTTTPDIMGVPQPDELVKRDVKTPVVKPTETIKKPIMVEVSPTLIRPIDLIRTDLRIKPTVDKTKPYRPTTIPVPIVRPIPVTKRAVETDVPVLTKTIKKSNQITMVKVDNPIRPIDLIRTDLRIEPSITKEKPYKPTSIPVPIVLPIPVPMGNDVPVTKRAVETTIPEPTKTKKQNQITMVKVDNPIRPIDLIRTDLRIEPSITKEKPYKPTSIPVPIVLPIPVPMGKDDPLQKE